MDPTPSPTGPPSSFRRWHRLPVPVRRAVVTARRVSHGSRRPQPRVDLDVTGGVAILTLDDGKVNAISTAAVRAFDDALGRALADDRVEALVIHGRPGQFSAGFDLDTLMVGGSARDEMIRAGWALLGRVLTLPLPVVAACTGNAVAAGAALVLTADARLGADGPYRIGFNEAAIGLPLPGVVLMLAGDRLRPDAVDEAMRQARLYAPRDAAAAGFLHEVLPAPDLLGAAVARARELAGRPDFRREKAAAVDPLAERMRRRLPEDLALIERIGA